MLNDKYLKLNIHAKLFDMFLSLTNNIVCENVQTCKVQEVLIRDEIHSSVPWGQKCTLQMFLSTWKILLVLLLSAFWLSTHPPLLKVAGEGDF